MTLRVEYIAPQDPVDGAGQLQILDDSGASNPVVLNCDLLTEDDRKAIEAFAFAVEEEPRRREYVKKYGSNRERIMQELREDFDDHFLRQRRTRDRYVGIDDAVLREWRRHR
jgi:hypothetical protein